MKRTVWLLGMAAVLLAVCASLQTGGTDISVADIRTGYFADVPHDSPWYDLVCYMCYFDLMDSWNENFYPNAPMELTRGQLAVKLEAYARQQGLDTTPKQLLPDFPDEGNIRQQERAALCWAVEQGLMRCFLGDYLLPNTAVSRLQFAQATVSVRALAGADALASVISAAMPVRENRSLAREKHDTIQAAVDQVGKQYGVAGLQVAVVENGTVTDTFAYGWATKGSDPMTADHKLRIASISKVAIGITAQLLREEGVVDLDADISQYWDVKVQNRKYPDIPITLRSMLTHTSSITCYGDSAPRTYSNVRQKLQGSGFSSSVPGDMNYWTYNNYAFSVLGMTLELAADRLVDDILHRRLYTAMDIDAAFAGGELKNKDMIATLYRSGGAVARTVAKQQSMLSDPTPGSTGTYFAGGMLCSSYDLAKLISLLANDGRYEGVQLMEEESIRLMEQRIEPATPGGSYQALPMRCWDDLYGRDTIYFHTGSAYGVFNAATYDPATGDGVVVLTTGGSGAKDSYGIYKSCAAINQYIYELLA